MDLKRADFVVSARWVLTQDKKLGDLEDFSVVVEGGKILDLIPTSKLRNSYQFEREIRGEIVVPGFVNAHTHAAMVAFRGIADDLPLMEWLEKHIWPREGKYVDRDFIKRALPVALAEMVKTGTTLYADMYFFQDEAARIVKDVGLKAVLGEGLISGATPSFKDPKDGLSFTREFIEEFKDDSNIFPALAPHAPYTCERELLTEAMGMAERYNVPYLIHVSETTEEVRKIMESFGVRPAVYLDRIGVLKGRLVAAHAVWLDEAEWELMRIRGAGVVHNPESNLKLASGIAPISSYLKLGIKVALGTDGAASNNDLDMMGEMRTAAFIQKYYTGDPTALNAKEVIHMATIGGAKVLGLDSLTGSISQGKDADMVVFNPKGPHAHPLYEPYSYIIYAGRAEDISHVISMGEIIYEEGAFHTIDIERSIAMLEELAKSLR